MTRINLIRLRGGTAALWTSVNPTLAAREPGVETDTGRVKYGDGVTAWTALPYSDTGELVFNAADFGAVGDGTADDTTAIQNAINAAAAVVAKGAPVVRIPKGTHLVTGLTGATGVSIQGVNSSQSILKVKTGTVSTKLLNLSSKTDVRITNLGFDGSSDTVCKSGVYANVTGTEKRIKIDHCSFKNFMPADTTSTHAAVYVWTAQGVEVINSFFSGCGRAITMDQPDGRVLIQGNHIIASTGVMATGIYLRRSSSSSLAQATIASNVIDGADYDPGGVGAEGHGIGVYRCRDVKIIGNTCLRSGRGILVSYLSYGAIISGNTVASNGDAGIRVEPDITGTDTTVGTAGVARGCTVVGNVAHDNAGIGITLSYAASSIVANNVSHNNLEYGIHTDSDRTLVIGNTCFNNWNGAATPSNGTKAGFSNYAGAGIVFVGNNAYDNQTVKTQDYGLSVTNAFAPVLLGNSFTGNRLGEVDNPQYVTQGMDGAYNNTHVVMGANHLWFDGSGNLRVKSSAPTSAGDGTSLMPASSAINLQVFTSNGTWTKPSGATTVQVTAIGAGGGGGSGRRGAVSTVRCGGGGGGAGGLSLRTFRASDVGATESVVVGTGGAGGVAVNADDTNGNNGSGGTASSTFGTGKVRAQVGSGGTGGTNALGTGGGAGVGMVTGGAGSSASTTGVANTASAASGGAVGGGSGGGIPTTNVVSAGGASGALGSVDGSTAAGGVVDSTAPGAGTAAGAPGEPGGGGGGGAGSITTVAQTGGAGGIYGGGGGGGGASLNGSNSGAGGAGAAGVVIVASW